MSRSAERAPHSRDSIAHQLARVQGELDQLREMVGNFDPTLLPEEVTADWVRGIIHARRQREEIFSERIFADPAWDILLVLYAGHLDNEQIIMTDVCKAAAVPIPTGIRWFRQLGQAGFITRTSDETDGRRIFLSLSKNGLSAMERCFKRGRLSDVPV